MGHAINYAEFDAKKYTTKQISSKIDSWVEGASDCHSGLPENIQFMDKVFPTYEEAQAYLEQMGSSRSYYEGAVKFEVKKETPKLLALHAKEADARKKYNQFDSTYYATTVKSEFIGCKGCNSRLNRNYILRTNHCPLCRTDLRSETTLSILSRLKANVQKAENEYAEEKKKPQRGAQVHWLVRYEYHV